MLITVLAFAQKGSVILQKQMMKLLHLSSNGWKKYIPLINGSFENKHQTLDAKGIGKQLRMPHGAAMVRVRGPYTESDIRKVPSMKRPGYGIWKELSAGRAELGFPGLGSIHLDLNINTGIGMRDGNISAHLIGFGFRIGADGVEIDTPIVGICLRFLAWPINKLISLLGVGGDIAEK